MMTDIHTTKDYRTANQLVRALDGKTSSITWSAYFDHVLPYLDDPSAATRQSLWLKLYQQWKESSNSTEFVDQLHTKCVQHLNCRDNYHNTRRKLCQWYQNLRFLE